MRTASKMGWGGGARVFARTCLGGSDATLTDLGNCTFGKLPLWENTLEKFTWENNFGKLPIGKMPFVKVGDYESARKYLAGYLAERDSQSMAHKLNGKSFCFVSSI